MIPAVTNHLWQSTLFAAPAGLLTLALRQNRARVRYWVWMASSIKFAVPFSLLVALGGHVNVRTAPVVHAPAMAVAIERSAQSFVVPVSMVREAPVNHFDATPFIEFVWASGALVVLAQ